MGYHLRIKICGVTNDLDAGAAATMGADAVGLNFAPESPRRVAPEAARTILRTLPPFVEPVGVFVNRPLRDIYPELHALGRMHTIQWHGKDRELADPYPYRLIATFQVRDKTSLQEMTRYLDLCRTMSKLPSAVLIDGHSPDKLGGTGKMAPWELLVHFRPGVPVILAGGLTPDNVADAVRIVQPWGVDVASGIESEPGKKDHEKLRKFIVRARNAAYQIK